MTAAPKIENFKHKEYWGITYIYSHLYLGEKKKIILKIQKQSIQ